MDYKYTNKENLEDYSSGRIIYHFKNKSNLPVRLGQEIFLRAYEKIGKERIIIYDPCCGNAYILTVLGFIENMKINSIFASDADEDSIKNAVANLSLLNKDKLLERKNVKIEKQIENSKEKLELVNESYNKLFNNLKHNINTTVFNHNIMNSCEGLNFNFLPDLVLVDVPYGNLENWVEMNDKNPIECLLIYVYDVNHNYLCGFI